MIVKILTSLTGAKYSDIIVNEVKRGSVHVTIMIRNYLVPKLQSLYMPENLTKTCQRMSQDLRHQIIKVVIQEVVVYTSGMFSST